jgi:hypothetical protein
VKFLILQFFFRSLITCQGGHSREVPHYAVFSAVLLLAKGDTVGKFLIMQFFSARLLLTKGDTVGKFLIMQFFSAVLLLPLLQNAQSCTLKIYILYRYRSRKKIFFIQGCEMETEFSCIPC